MCRQSAGPADPEGSGSVEGVRTEISKAALGVDIRSGQTFHELHKVLDELDGAKIQYEILYLESEDDVLIKRYKETRRFHPLAGSQGRIEDGIREERKKLQFLKERGGLYH